MTTTTNAAKPAVNEALTLQLARQANGYHFGPQTEYDKMSNTVVGKNGLFRVVKTAIATFTTKVADMKEGYVVPGLPEMKEGIELHIPKIPFKYWLMPLSFYKDIHGKDGTEASVLFFWNHDEVELPAEYNNNAKVHGVIEDGQLIVYCPQQKNSAGLSEFHNDGMVKWLRENTTPLLETHSHHTMDAYFSGTDDANENYYQFYAVYGKITSQSPMFAFRFCSGKHKVQISPWELFENPNLRVAAQLEVDGQIYDIEAPTGYNGPWPKLPYPEDWMGQHSTTYRTVNNNYSRSNDGWEQGKVWNYQTRKYEWPEEKKTSGALANQAGQTSATKNGTPTTGGTHGTGTTEKNARKRDVVETETSRVEIIMDDVISKFTRQQVVELVTHLCEFGYDFHIHEGLKEASV